MTQANFEISVDTRLLHQRLSKVPVGAEITYAELGEIVGRKVEGADSHLQSALRRCMTSDEIVFDNVRGVGYRRLSDAEIVDAATRDTDSLRRKSRRAAKRLMLVADMASMPSEKRVEHNARLSLFAAITAMTKPKGVDAIRESVKQAGGELPLAKTLEAFRRNSAAA